MRSVDSGVPSQPRGDTVVGGARRRAAQVGDVFQTCTLASALNLVSLSFLAQNLTYRCVQSLMGPAHDRTSPRFPAR
jgi:hypothetical protein